MTLIKREDAIETVAKLQKYDLDERNRLRIYAPWHKPKRIFVETEAIYKTIYTLPSSEAEWIPCSERLPNTAEQVLISVCDDHGDTPYHYTCVGWRCENYWISDNDYVFGGVLAWMPLPEPYKAESEEVCERMVSKWKD